MKKQLLVIASILLVTLSAGAGAQPALVYQVSFKGTVNTNNVPFSSSGLLYLTSTIDKTGTQKNGINPVDLALISGSPASASSPGAIWYFTNYALYRLVGGGSVSNSALDLAYVSQSGNCVTVQPDTNFLTGLHYSNPSIFTVKSSLTAQIYSILRGTMQVCSNDGWKTVTGTINYWGSSFYSSPFASMPYKATISGKYVGNINF